jgi:hypothetical protein
MDGDGGKRRASRHQKDKLGYGIADYSSFTGFSIRRGGVRYDGADFAGFARFRFRRGGESDNGVGKSGFTCGNMHDSAFWRKANAQRDGNVMPIAQSWAEIIIPVFAIVSALLLLERRIARLEARVEFIVQRLFPLDERSEK